MHPAELESKLITKGISKGISQGYLEWRLRQFSEEGIGETFMDVLALTLYRAMLFPNMENIVDHTAINVFLAYKNHSESPINAILVDVYESLNLCYELKKKKMLFCLLVLYVWFISRINKGISNAIGPVEEVLLNKPEIKGAKDWALFCARLNRGKIKWCLP